MHFVISTQELNFLLSKMQNIVSLKPSAPILNNVMICAANDEIVMVTTDLKVGMRCVTEAKVFGEGATTLPAKKLAQLMREIRATHVEFVTGDHEVTEIIAGDSRFKLHGMRAREYPALPDLSAADRFTMPQQQLRDLLYRTSFAVSREEGRFALMGVNLSFEQGQAIFVGTDGKCLARAVVQVASPLPAERSYTIPIKAVEELVKWLGDEGEVTLFLTAEKITFQLGSTTLISKLLSGDYPDVSRVIPKSSSHLVGLHREELMALLRQISLFMQDGYQSVRFTFSEGELALRSNSSDLGEGQVKMAVDYRGERLDVAFNPTYLHNILKHCSQESVLCGLEDAFSPCLLTDQVAPPQKQDGALFVLMPMRLSQEG